MPTAPTTHSPPGRLLRCLLLASLLLVGCGSPAALPPTHTPATVAEHQNSDTRIVAPEQPEQPAPVTSAPLPTQPVPTDLPEPSPTATFTQTLNRAATSHVLDVAAQTAAMLPDTADHLLQANQWDQYVITGELDPATLTLHAHLHMAIGNREAVPYTDLFFWLYPNHPFFRGSLRIEEVRVNGQVVAATTELDGLLLRVPMPQPLPPGEYDAVDIRFATSTPQNASSTNFGAFNWEAGVWSLANFYPVLARRFGGAWDRSYPDDQGDLIVTETALYDVTIDTPPAWQLVTTGARVAATPLENGLRRERFVSGPQREFYLAALRGLERASMVVDGTRITSYYQGDNPQTGQASLEAAAVSLQTFNARFGRYPLAELDVIQVALTQFLGMEFPGVVIIEDRLYTEGGRGLETTVAHEVGHQWWYSLVGSDQQREPWLDESLASYMQILYYEGRGNTRAAENELALLRSYYLNARNNGRDAPVSGPAGSFRQGNYVAIVYAKGAVFYHALRLRLGDETFFAFMQNYYATHRYETATTGDVLQTAQATCGCDLQAFFASWIHQTAAVEVP